MSPENAPQEPERLQVLTAAMIVKDEEQRLEDSLSHILAFADQIVILDDGSTDNTEQMIKDLIAENPGRIFYHRNEESMFWDAENDLREQLWQEILPQYSQDWVMAIDMDEEIDKRFVDLKQDMLTQENVNGYTFQFWEFWNDKEHVRIDRNWNPGQKQIPLLIRWLPQVNYQWSVMTLHGGRVPLNIPEPIIPSGLHIKHYGWSISDAKIRRKYKMYMERDPNPHPQMLQHYHSIVYGPRVLIRWYLD